MSTTQGKKAIVKINNNPKFLMLLSQEVSKKISRELTSQEHVFIITTLSSMNMKHFTKYTLTNIIAVLSGVLAEKIKDMSIQSKRDFEEKQKEQVGEVDIREVLKQEVVNTSSSAIASRGVTKVREIMNSLELKSILGLRTVEEIQALFNPSALFVKNYIVMDSQNRNLALNSNKRFQWQYVNNANVAQGTVNTVGTVKNLIAMQLYQPIIPRSPELNDDTGRVSILIEEFAAQSFIASAERRYHFLTRYVLSGTPTANRLQFELQIEDYGEGLFKFRTPITTFDTITVSFGDPINLLTFYPDRDRVTFTAYSAAPFGPTEITTSIPHNLLVGERVLFTEFTTNDPVADQAIIDIFNRPYGVFVNTVISPTVFTIGIDTFTINGIPNLEIPILYPAKRFIFALELTYLKDY